MAERFSDWHHKKHDANASREDVAVGRKILGQLVEELRLGRATSGTRRVTLPSGATVLANVAMGIPTLQVTAPASKPTRRRVFDLYGCVNTVLNIEVVKLGRYESEDYDGAPLVSAGKPVIELIGTIDIGAAQDPLGMAVDSKRGLLYVCNYSNTTPGDRLIIADLKTLEVAANIRPDVPAWDFHPYAVAVSQDTGKTAIVNYGAAAGESPGYLYDYAEPALPVQVPALIDRVGEDVVFSPSGELAYFCSSLGGALPAQIIVVDVATNTSTIGFTTHDGFYENIACSADGKFLYITGEDEPDPYPDLDGDQSKFIAKIDAETGAVLAKVNGGYPTHLDVSPDGKLLVANDGANSWLWVYETALMPDIADYTTEALLVQPGMKRIMDVDSAASGYTVCEVRFTPDSKRVICTTRLTDGTTEYLLLSIDVKNDTAIQFKSPADGLLNELVLFTRRKPDRIIEG